MSPPFFPQDLFGSPVARIKARRWTHAHIKSMHIFGSLMLTYYDVIKTALYCVLRTQDAERANLRGFAATAFIILLVLNGKLQ